MFPVCVLCVSTLSLFSCVCVCCTLTVCGAKLCAATYRRAPSGVFRKRSLEGKKLEILYKYFKTRIEMSVSVHIIFSSKLFCPIRFNFYVVDFSQVIVSMWYLYSAASSTSREYNYQTHWFSSLYHFLNAFPFILLLIHSSSLHGLNFLRFVNSQSLCIITIK